MAFVFAVTCVMVAFFAYATVRRPHAFFAAFLVLFTIVAALLAYRVFAFSNDWYRAQERKEQIWYARHPRLAIWLSVLAVAGFLWQLWVFIVPMFQ